MVIPHLDQMVVFAQDMGAGREHQASLQAPKGTVGPGS